jgi:hypothetical protein
MDSCALVFSAKTVFSPDADPHVLGLLDPDPYPLVRGLDPDTAPDPDPSLSS